MKWNCNTHAFLKWTLKLILQYVKTPAHFDKCNLTELSTVCDKKYLYVHVCECVGSILWSQLWKKKHAWHTMQFCKNELQHQTTLMKLSISSCRSQSPVYSPHSSTPSTVTHWIKTIHLSLFFSNVLCQPLSVRSINYHPCQELIKGLEPDQHEWHFTRFTGEPAKTANGVSWLQC